ncbi:MAG: uracil-DNA glycosylase [Dehalococcoidia bacterium]|nr:uracil-DNA glycosylase [Dehalococcoidia bacterium]
MRLLAIVKELEQIAARVRVCVDCSLCQGRTNAVPGEGPDTSKIMFIGEGPGFYEDQQGRPFVGPSGRLLESLLVGIGLNRNQVFITNVVKCRPPENRDPLPNEIQACAPYLSSQIQALKPKIIVTLGRFSMTHFFPQETISKVHGRARKSGGFMVYPLYHPAAALRSAVMKKALEDDFKRIPALLKDIEQAASPNEPPAKQLKLI